MLPRALLLALSAAVLVTSTPLPTPEPQAPEWVNNSPNPPSPNPPAPGIPVPTASVPEPAAPVPAAPAPAATTAPPGSGPVWNKDAPVTAAAEPTGYFLTTKKVIIPGVTNDVVNIPGKTIEIVLPTCIQTIEPDKNGYVPPGECGSLYNYYPSFIAAIIASVTFGILTVAHITQAAMLKKKFAWVIIMGCIWETSAFATRAISTKYQQNAGIALVSTIFVLLAPLWINAFAYMVLARMIHYFHPSKEIFNIPAAGLSIVFVTLDIISFIIQLAGGAYANRKDPYEKQMKGVHIYMGGIALQQFFIFIFIAVAIRFHFQMAALQKQRKITKNGWKILLWTLYTSLACVTTRIIYRLVEFSAGKGTDNPITHHEYYFYALEAGPMFLAIFVFNFTHPGSVLKGKDSEMPSLFGMAKRKVRGRKSEKADDQERLVGHKKYSSLDNPAPAHMTDGFVEMHGRVPPRYE